MINNNKNSSMIIIILFSVSIVIGIFIIITGGSSGSVGTEASVSDSALSTIGFSQKNTVAVLNIFDTIAYTSDSGYLFSQGGAIEWVEMLKSVEDDPNIEAVVLRINSPGGTVGATQEVYNQVLRLREMGKIVVVSIGDMGASGAYYIACAADYIVANPGALVGSIGVIMSSVEISGLMEDLGINYNVIKSGDNKDMLSMFREMSDEEESLLTEMIMDVYSQFVGAVSEGRGISLEDLSEIADGRVFSGGQALEVGLIDQLGDFEQTIDIAAEMAGITGEPNVIELGPGMMDIFEYIGYSFGNLLNAKTDIDLIGTATSELMENQYSPVMYLYNY